MIQSSVTDTKAPERTLSTINDYDDDRVSCGIEQQKACADL